MKLLIPVDGQNYSDAKIASIDNKIGWLCVEMDGGNVKRDRFFKDRAESKDLMDFVVLKDKSENFEEFLDEGIDVLLAPFQKSVEDIVEAYNFRELHEI